MARTYWHLRIDRGALYPITQVFETRREALQRLELLRLHELPAAVHRGDKESFEPIPIARRER